MLFGEVCNSASYDKANVDVNSWGDPGGPEVSSWFGPLVLSLLPMQQ